MEKMCTMGHQEIHVQQTECLEDPLADLLSQSEQDLQISPWVIFHFLFSRVLNYKF